MIEMSDEILSIKIVFIKNKQLLMRIDIVIVYICPSDSTTILPEVFVTNISRDIQCFVVVTTEQNDFLFLSLLHLL